MDNKTKEDIPTPILIFWNKGLFDNYNNIQNIPVNFTQEKLFKQGVPLTIRHDLPLS